MFFHGFLVPLVDTVEKDHGRSGFKQAKAASPVLPQKPFAPRLGQGECHQLRRRSSTCDHRKLQENDRGNLWKKTQEKPYFTLNYKEIRGFSGFFPGKLAKIDVKGLSLVRSLEE